MYDLLPSKRLNAGNEKAMEAMEKARSFQGVAGAYVVVGVRG
jgi:hypothetical protein